MSGWFVFWVLITFGVNSFRHSISEVKVDTLTVSDDGVDLLLESRVARFNRNGVIQSEVTRTPNGSVSTTYSYTEDKLQKIRREGSYGRLLAETIVTYNVDETIVFHVTRNDAGRRISVRTVTKGFQGERTEVEYFDRPIESFSLEDHIFEVPPAHETVSFFDVHGRLREVSFRRLCVPVATLHVSYDETQRLVTISRNDVVDSDQQLLVPDLPLTIVNRYDHLGQAIETTTSWGSEVAERVLRTYTTTGLVSKENPEHLDAGTSEVTYEYDFNAMGDWVTKTTLLRQDGAWRPVSRVVRTIKYWSNW